MPNIRHLRISFELLSRSDAVELVRQTRRDRLAYVPPKAKKKASTGLDKPVRKPRAAKDPNAPKAKRKPRAAKAAVDPKAELLNMLSKLNPEQKAALIARLGEVNK
jgi:hypothetical protein